MKLKEVYESVPAKHVFLMLIMTIVFALAVLSRTYPAGNDAYYFLSKGSTFLYENILMIFCMFLTMFITAYLAREVGVRQWKLAGILAFCAPTLVFRMAVFENDIFALPICLLALLFMFKYDNEDINIYLIASAVLLTTAFSIWIGAIVFIAFFIFHYALKINTFVGILTLCGFIALMPPTNNYIPEMRGGYYAIVFATMWILAGLTEYKQFPDNLKEMIIFFGIPAFMMIKFITFFCIPLGMAATYIVEKKNIFKGVSGTIFMIWCLMGFVVGAGTVMQTNPSNQLMSDLYEVTAITQGEPIANDWSFGHILNWMGAFPMDSPYNPQPNFTLHPYAMWALTNETLNYPIVKQYDGFALYNISDTDISGGE